MTTPSAEAMAAADKILDMEPAMALRCYARHIDDEFAPVLAAKDKCIDDLLALVADYRASQAQAVGERCGDDEHHCTCVPYLRRHIAELKAESALLRGAMRAQDERERNAGATCGVPYEQSDCDWPEAVAEEVIVLRRRVAELERRLENAARADRMVETVRKAISPEAPDA